MNRFVGPAGVMLGLVTAIIGVLFQAAGAAAAVYCSVIGGGIVLFVLGGVIWSVPALRHRTPSSLAT